MTSRTRLSLAEHLEELRKRILRALFFIAVLSCIAYAFSEKMLSFLMKPVGKLVFTSPPEMFSSYLKISFFAGIVLAAPFILYEVWKFASSGLKPEERKYVFLFGPLSYILFVTGVLFNLFAAAPFAVKFLLGFQTASITPMITVNNYITFIGVFSIVFGCVFELPLVLGFLTKLGMVTPALLSSKRRYAVLLIFIASAVFTPPDVISQILMAVPLLILYEISIIVSRLLYRGKSQPVCYF